MKKRPRLEAGEVVGEEEHKKIIPNSTKEGTRLEMPLSKLTTNFRNRNNPTKNENKTQDTLAATHSTSIKNSVNQGRQNQQMGP